MSHLLRGCHFEAKFCKIRSMSEKCSRLSFLQMSIGFASAAVLTNLPPIETLYGLDTPKVLKSPSEVFKERIEARRHMTFLSPTDELNKEIFPTALCDENLMREQVLPWDIERLRIVDELYAKLPSFYSEPAIDESGVKHFVELLLVGSRDGRPVAKPHVSQHQFRDKSSGRHRLVFSTARFKTTEEDRGGVDRIILHESTHFVTSQRLEYFNSVIANPLGIANNEDLRLVFEDALKTKSIEETDECGNPTGLMQEKVLYKNQIGYGSKNLSEFYSVATPQYFQGKDIFVNAYKPYLGKKKTELFYDLVKRYLFDMKEFN